MNAAAPDNVADGYRRLEAAARATLDRDVYDWFAGGAGGERSVRGNEQAWDRWNLRPRVLVDVSHTTTATTVLDQSISLPVIVAPTAFQRCVHPEGELAMARGAAAAGTIMCVSTMATASFAAISDAAPSGVRWQQLYHLTDRGATRALAEMALDAGATAMVLTVDAPVRGRRDRPPGPAFTMPPPSSTPNVRAVLEPSAGDDLEALVSRTLTWNDLDWMLAETGVPLVLKGILDPRDAAMACSAGAAGVIVSNHGGRQLDGTIAPIDALPEIVTAVDGRCEVLVDGGVRRGRDVAVALALGARAVLVGRPTLWALAVGGSDGVRSWLDGLAAEVLNTLMLLGATTPDAVERAHVSR